MTTPQLTTRTARIKRNAFTLVELMIVIVIIGILVGISSPFIFAAIERAKEFTIQNEIVQMDAAVQRFETKYGFFPPAIGPGLEIDTSPSANSDAEIAKFRRYLNRIAPNHAEGGPGSGGGLDNWWNQVGANLNAESSLVFWLSGLCTSKQYPLSGNAMIVRNRSVLAPYNANKDVNDADLPFTIDRDVFFEFTSGQIVINDPTAGVNGIKSYHQPEGKGDSLAYQYRDSRSYEIAMQPPERFVADAYHVEDAAGNKSFFNPGTFQIIGPGMDGKVTRQTDLTAVVVTNTFALASPSTEADVDPEQDDNITNFANGRLDLVFE